MTHSFLLIGQSNAAGRGFLTEAEPLDTCNGRLKVLRNGRWIPMFRPVNPDRVFSGVCFAESFAKAYAGSHPDVNVGIIPCADGGTEISQWLPGEVLYDNAVNCAKLAMRTSTLRGILWHQGESDCSAEKCAVYAEKFALVMDSLRRDIGKADIPILIGGLGDYLANCPSSPDIREYHSSMNLILESLGTTYPHCAFVPATGLSGNPDNLHFSTAALQELGARYKKAFDAFDRMYEDDDESLNGDTVRTALELL